jgi:hypothetical protein
MAPVYSVRELEAMAGSEASRIRVVLNQWDPAGVAALVDDEYDPLVEPLRERLEAGDGVAEITQFLVLELHERYDLDPFTHDPEPLAQDLVNLWRSG